MTHGLSKSRLTLHDQCPRRLWLAVHRPELAEVSEAVTAGLADGHRVGDIACALHPDGILIDGANGMAAALAETTRLLALDPPRPLFEATFAHDGVLIRADLLLPEPGGWHLVEVKATAGVKHYHHGDLATQLWVIRASGLPVTRASIRHIDRAFSLTRPGAYAGLFVDVRLDETLAPLVAARAMLAAKARATLAGPEPEIAPGDQCTHPFSCSFTGWCGRDLPPPPDWPVSLLPDAAGRKVADAALAQGIDDLTALAADALPSPKLRRIHAATLSGTAYHDRQAIADELARWAWPRTFLDFETIAFAIPRWCGTRPWQQVPFQFSAHVDTADGALTHQGFLDLSGDDPRRGCAEALLALPSAGAIIAWNAGFERACILGLAETFPDLAPALRAMAARIVDLLPVVRRHYYHRDMRGSWSIKAVLPTLAPDLGYDALAVGSGQAAQAAYVEAVDTATATARRDEIAVALRDYCRRDTDAMRVVMGRLVGPVQA